MIRSVISKALMLLLFCSLSSIHTEKAFAMLAVQPAEVYFAVNDGEQTIAVQGNPSLIQDDSLSDSLALIFLEVRDAPSGGGSPVFGFVQSPGPVSSALNIFATPSIPDVYWNTQATLYGRFELRDGGGGLENSWEIPFFLRTIDSITFDFTQYGDPLPIQIGGDLPSSPPDYSYTGFGMDVAPKGSLLGLSGGADADIRIDVSPGFEQAYLQVIAPPYDGTTPLWDILPSPFDLTITSQTLYYVAEHHFNGLDYQGNPCAAAQPLLTVHPVPEPATMGLVAVGVLTLLIRRRRTG